MRKAILIPDSFKGTMSSEQICNIMEKALKSVYNDIEVVKIPVADGGEGSVDSFLTALDGEKVFTTVKGPYFEDVEAFYGIIENGKTAVIEMAAASGLPLVMDNKDPSKTTTYGVGELVNHAISKGVKKVIMCLGGSSTNDAGCGMLSAMGVKFTKEDGVDFIPTGGTLSSISKIDTVNLKRNINEIEFVTMCDIDNPLYGIEGAAYVFAPQKGANPEMVEFLDRELKVFHKIVNNQVNLVDSNMAGAGAAGGMGYSMKGFVNSKIQMGIETVLDTVQFDAVSKNADIIFTGEGKIDNQSLRGKVVMGVAKRAKKLGLPVIAVVGDIGDDIEVAYSRGVTAIFSINRVAVPYKEAKTRAQSDLYLTMENIARFHNVLK